MCIFNKPFSKKKGSLSGDIGYLKKRLFPVEKSQSKNFPILKNEKTFNENFYWFILNLEKKLSNQKVGSGREHLVNQCSQLNIHQRENNNF